MLTLLDLLLDASILLDLLDVILPNGFDSDKFRKDSKYRRTKIKQIVTRIVATGAAIAALGTLIWLGTR